jgi:hypothetical protein
VQQSVRTQLLDLPAQCVANRWGLQTAYTTLTQLLALMPTHTRTSVPDQIRLLMKCILDDEVRRDANRGDCDTLEDAYQAILRAVANEAHNRAMNTQRPPHPKPHPRPPRYPQPRTSQTKVPSNPPTAPAMGSQSVPPAMPPTAPPTLPPMALPAPKPYRGKLTQEERQRCIQQGLCFSCREPGHSQLPHVLAVKKLEQLGTPATVSEADPTQLHLSTTVVEALEPCIVLDIAVVDRQARALVDSGANACFVSQGFCMKHRIPVHAPKHRSATLANSSSATIHGQTTPQVVKIQQFSALVVFQVLDTLDGIDVVLGMNFLSAHSITI